MSLLAIQKIYKEYNNKVVLNGVTLNIEKNERVALIGSNGSGKSTLLKIAMGEVMADTGSVSFSRGIEVGYLSQSMKEVDDITTALHYEKVHTLEVKIKKIEDELSCLDYANDLDEYDKLMKNYSKLLEEFELLDGYVVQNKIKKILLGLGLRKESLYLPLSKLSGGEKMRVLLARILLKEPDLLMLDEPTNHLDIKAIEWLEEYLKKFTGGVLIVSHDRYFLDRVTTRVADLQGGKVNIKSCSYSSYLEQKRILKDFYIKEHKNMKIRLRDEEELVRKLRKYKKIKQSKSKEKQVDKLRAKMNEKLQVLKESENLGKKFDPRLKFDKIKHLSKDIVSIRNLSKSFGNVKLLRDIELEIHGGERVAIIGPNGCGKTTLLNIILGKDKEYEGLVKFGDWVEYCYLGQEIEFEDESVSILEEVIKTKEMSVREARRHLARFQFYGDVVQNSLKILSGGEKVRVALACMMLKNPHCLILDEPTNHLDLESRESIERAIMGFEGTVISVSHDRYYLNQCVNRIIDIIDGEVRSFSGNYDFYKKSIEKKSNITKEKKSPVTQRKTEIKTNRPVNENPEKEALEGEIFSLEEKLKEMELAKTSNHKDFAEFGKISKELENLYERYYTLELQ